MAERDCQRELGYIVASLSGCNAKLFYNESWLSYCPAARQTEIGHEQTYFLTSPGMSLQGYACLAFREPARRKTGSVFLDVQEILEMLFSRNLFCKVIIFYEDKLSLSSLII